MASEVTMPKMGYDMTEGTLLKWVKQEGDTVAAGDVLGEIETGKVNIEIEAFDAGVLRRILVREGETVPVGTPIAIIGTADEVLPEPAPRPATGDGMAAAGANGAAAATPSGPPDSASTPPASLAATPSANGASAPPATAAPASAGTNVAPVGTSAAATSAVAGPPLMTMPGGASALGDEGSMSDAAGHVRISPLARRLAAEHAVPVRALHGSGPFGRIVRDDVLDAVAHGVALPAGAGAAAAPAGPAPGPATAAASVASAQPSIAPVTPPAMPAMPAAAPAILTLPKAPAVYLPGAEPPADVTESLSRMRQTIARRLTESWSAAPHIFVTVPIFMDEALALRRQANATLEASGRTRLSVNDLVLKAAAVALRVHPRMNSSWADGQRLVHGRVNIGVAVALEDGLITVTVPDADAKPLSAIAAEVAGMAERARSGHLMPEDVAVASTFTVSNLGGYGVEEFTAIINPPEAAILAVGAATPTPVVVDGAIVVRSVMRVTLSADHRVVDGASAADYLATLRRLLEQPVGMLV